MKRAPRRPWLPTAALGKVYVPTSAPKGAETELVGLPGPDGLGEQAMAAKEKRGQGRHY